MKKIWKISAKLAFIFMLCSCGNTVMAEGKLTRDPSISNRLKNIRARLDKFQKKNQHSASTSILDSVELKIEPEKINYEKISSNFETRDDVKMITLFHDPEFGNDSESNNDLPQDLITEKKPVTIDDLRQKFKQNTSNTKLRASRIREMVAELR